MNLHLRPDATADRREGERRREPSKQALRVQNAALVEALKRCVSEMDMFERTGNYDNEARICRADARALLQKVTP